MYGLYVQRVGMLAEKNAELTESYAELVRQNKSWELQDQEYNDRINKMAAEQLEMAIKNKTFRERTEPVRERQEEDSKKEKGSG